MLNFTNITVIAARVILVVIIVATFYVEAASEQPGNTHALSINTGAVGHTSSSILAVNVR